MRCGQLFFVDKDGDIMLMHQNESQIINSSFIIKPERYGMPPTMIRYGIWIIRNLLVNGEVKIDEQTRTELLEISRKNPDTVFIETAFKCS